MLQTEVVEKINTHILCSIPFIFKNFATYEIKWKNTVEAGRPKMTIWCKCTAWWIPKSNPPPPKKKTTVCHTYYISPVTMVAPMPLYVKLQVHCLSCYSLPLW
jgi:hypothetical protein